MTSTVDLRPMLIAGTPARASDGGVLDSINPATAEVIAQIPQATAADVDRAVASAAEAFPAWKRTPAVQRAAAVAALADRVVEHAEELAVLDVLDNGSPIGEMRNDAGMAAAMMRYLAGGGAAGQGRHRADPRRPSQLHPARAVRGGRQAGSLVGVHAVAAGVSDPSGRVVAALVAAAGAERMPRPAFAGVASVLAQSAATLAIAL